LQGLSHLKGALPYDLLNRAWDAKLYHQQMSRQAQQQPDP